MTAKEKIDEYIRSMNDWRGALIKEIREIIHEVLPDITEDWKWNSPVFSHKGTMICSPGGFKNHVGLNFFNGAAIKDTDGLFNGGTASKKSRSINFNREDRINRKALRDLLAKAAGIGDPG